MKSGHESAWIARYTAPLPELKPGDSRILERTQRALRSVGFSRPNATALALDPEATAAVFAGVGAVGGVLLGVTLVALFAPRCPRTHPAASVTPTPTHK